MGAMMSLAKNESVISKPLMAKVGVGLVGGICVAAKGYKFLISAKPTSKINKELTKAYPAAARHSLIDAMSEIEIHRNHYPDLVGELFLLTDDACTHFENVTASGNIRQGARCKMVVVKAFNIAIELQSRAATFNVDLKPKLERLRVGLRQILTNLTRVEIRIC
jgi:hypothetical protein